jgi:ABC-2 type transport system permease protein
VRKTFHVAMREFKSTVMTKGFIVGVLLTPVILLIVVFAMMLTTKLKGPTVVGEIALIDRTGSVAPGVVDAFSEQGLERERDRIKREAGEMADKTTEMLGVDPETAKQGKQMSGMAVDMAVANTPDLTVTVLDSAADPEPLKDALKTVDITAKDESGGHTRQRIGVAVINPDALVPNEAGEYGKFELYTAQRIDFQIQERIARRIGRSIVDARLASDRRIGATGMTTDQLRQLVSEPRGALQTMTPHGERKSNEIFSMLIPLGFMMLLFIAVMTGGQYLVTTVVEEKASRVMEVLLSAVSPLELMVGKILGQMLVGLVILVLYSGLGITALIAYSQSHLLQPMNVVYILIFFFISFFVVASLLAAVGSAVTELREAQTLMTPIMVSMALPYLLWMPVSRAPNSTFSTVLSFIPVINPFVMVIRLGGSEPIPAWQPPVCILVGLVTVAFCAWAAAKVFRIGVLMYGKPPNIKTLMQWVRMA